MLQGSSKYSYVKEVLAELMERLQNCQDQTVEYRQYQEEFDLELTKFDFLDSVIHQVKIRLLLWDNFQSWNESCEEW